MGFMPHATTFLRRIAVISPTASRADFFRTLADQAVLRRAELMSEARRLLRRRTTAMAVAARCRAGARRMSEDAAEMVSLRAMRRAAALHLRFHKTLDALVDAGGFDEAMGILRERRRCTPAHSAELDGLGKL
jgi:hypothetical protein